MGEDHGEEEVKSETGRGLVGLNYSHGRFFAYCDADRAIEARPIGTPQMVDYAERPRLLRDRLQRIEEQAPDRANAFVMGELNAQPGEGYALPVVDSEHNSRFG